MRVSLFCLINIACIVGLSTQTVPDSLFREWAPNGPGGVVCVVHDGKAVFQKGFGMADVSRKIPNSLTAKYDLASNAKQFTAMCIALLEEQGKISKDDPLRKFYPGLKIKDDIRIHHLIDHTSGLRDASVLAVLSGKMNLKGEVRKKFDTKEYYIRCMMSETDLNYPVGQEMAYNNFNYVLLADIVEKVSGRTLPQFMDSAIFKPLGMTQTFLRDKRKLKFENESVGYLWKGGSRYKAVDGRGGILGDHNLVNTVEDIMKWQMNFFDNKLGKRDPALITKVSTASRLNDGSSTFYGYGLFDAKYKNVDQVYHGGDDGRQTSILARFPEHKLSIIVLSNTSRYNLTEKIAYQLADVFLQGSLTEIVPEKSKDEDFVFIDLPPEQIKSKAGLYTRINERGLAQMITLTYSNGKLTEQWGNQVPTFEMQPVTNSHFVAKTKSNRAISLKFNEDEQSFTYQYFTLDTLHFKKSPPFSNSLSDYKGIYKNKSTSAKIKVKKRRDKLIARKGIIRIPLMNFGTDQFYAPDNAALFTFVRDSNRRIISLKVDAPDFRNFWLVKD